MSLAYILDRGLVDAADAVLVHVEEGLDVEIDAPPAVGHLGLALLVVVPAKTSLT